MAFQGRMLRVNAHLLYTSVIRTCLQFDQAIALFIGLDEDVFIKVQAHHMNRGTAGSGRLRHSAGYFIDDVEHVNPCF
jgi:hypothetical protein